MNNSILQLENLVIGYQKKSLIEAINVSVDKGELITILGKNGIGKSTLIHTILGFQSPIAGHIYFEGTNSEKLNSNNRSQKVAVVLSKLTHIPAIKVFELIEMGRLPYLDRFSNLSKKDENNIAEIAELVGISDLLNRYANQLSEGQLQLVMIARALCQDTPLIILDEPTSNLDVENQYKVFELIKDLKRKTNKSFIMITHEIPLAIDFSDRIWWIENANLYQGVPEQIALEKQIIPKLSGDYLSFKNKYLGYTKDLIYTNEIQLIGDSELAYWVAKALTRKGYKIVENAGKMLEIRENLIIFEKFKFKSIEDLLNHL